MASPQFAAINIPPGKSAQVISLNPQSTRAGYLRRVHMITHSFLRLIMVAAFVACGSAASAQMKIGTVDIDRAIKQHGKTKEAEAKIKEAQQAAAKEFRERGDAYKKTLDELNRINQQLAAPALSPAAKTAKAKERDEKIGAVRTMEREITEFRETRKQQLQQQALRFRDGIVKEISEVVMERVQASNMDLVFDKSGASSNGFSPVMFIRGETDLTAEVIAALKTRGQSAAASGSASAAPSTSPRKP